MNKPNDFHLNCITAFMELREKEGITDPSCREVAQQVMMGKKPPPALIDAVRVDIRPIMVLLRKNYRLLVTTTGELYYAEFEDRVSFRELPPQDEDECKFVSPLGKGKRRYGFYTAHDKDDIYWLYMNSFHRHSAARSTSEGTRRLVEARGAGHIQLRPARKEARKTLNTVVPANISELGNLSEGDNGILPQ